MKQDRYGDLVETLKSRVPGFVTSSQYQMHRGEIDDLPGVVLACFGQYMISSVRDGDGCARPLSVLMEVADWSDPMVDTSLRDEFFEVLQGDPIAERAIREAMSGRLQKLYEKWVAAQ